MNDHDTSNVMLAAALGYAARGWRVFPLHTPDPTHPSGCSCRRLGCGRNAGKHPWTMNGFKDASIDPDVILSWWTRWPRANIGVATGSGLVVLDVDPRHGGDRSLDDLVAAHGLIQAPTVRTGGGGLHFYMAGDLPTKGGFRPGLDLKGARGYVVAPPSLHKSGVRYEWINYQLAAPQAVPDWLPAIIDPPRTLPSGPPPTITSVSAGYVRTAIEAECMAVAEAPEGTRNNRLNAAAYALARFISAGGVRAEIVVQALYTAGRYAGLSEREILSTIRSAFRARGLI